MKKNGFVFIETIITVVVLSASLLALYNTYSSSIYNEKERINYDDVAFIYRANQVRKFLYGNTNIENLKKYAFDNTYVITIGASYSGNSLNVNDTMFTEDQKARYLPGALETVVNNMNINQMLLVKSDYMLNCFDEDEVCLKSTSNISNGIKYYLRSLNKADSEFYLVMEFAEKEEDGKKVKCFPNFDYYCDTYYAYLEI